MKVLFAHLNACSHIRDHLKRSDLEDDNVWELFRHLFSCSCDNCLTGTDDGFGRDGDGVSMVTPRNKVSSIPDRKTAEGALLTAPNADVPQEEPGEASNDAH